MHLILLFDNSGSITGGNDPIGQRFREAELALHAVGRRCRCGKDVVSVVHFDTPTSGDLYGMPLTRAHWPDIDRSLAVPRDGRGASLLGSSLRQAFSLAFDDSERYPVLVALSDFELFDEHLEAVYDVMATFPGDVHAVSLRAPSPSVLRGMPTVTVTEVNHQSRPGTLARAVFAALCATRPGAQPLPRT